MLTDEEFRLFRDLIYKESGIYLKESLKDFLENRLMKRLTATGTSSPYWYYKFITDRQKTELLILLDLLTVNETSFFRNRPQIELFRDVILPDVMKKKMRETQKSLRIWSAGCSTGEEPYSIAMILLEAVPYHWLWDIKIFASDLSLTALEVASTGEYTEDKVNATVDDYYINKYFEKTNLPSPPSAKGGRGGLSENGDSYKVTDMAKKFVIFDFHNLKNDNGLRNLDIIFCRNVMIYFDMEEQKRLVNKFYQSLNPGGYLLIGHAESLQGLDTDFQFIYHNGGTAYKKTKGEKYV